MTNNIQDDDNKKSANTTKEDFELGVKIGKSNADKEKKDKDDDNKNSK